MVAQFEHMGSESWSLSIPTAPMRRPECGFKCFGRGALCSLRLKRDDMGGERVCM